jgi:hypothetical protein
MVARLDGADKLVGGIESALGDLLDAAAKELGKDVGKAAFAAVIGLVAA